MLASILSTITSLCSRRSWKLRKWSTALLAPDMRMASHIHRWWRAAHPSSSIVPTRLLPLGRRRCLRSIRRAATSSSLVVAAWRTGVLEVCRGRASAICCLLLLLHATLGSVGRLLRARPAIWWGL